MPVNSCRIQAPGLYCIRSKYKFMIHFNRYFHPGPKDGTGAPIKNNELTKTMQIPIPGLKKLRNLKRKSWKIPDQWNMKRSRMMNPTKFENYARIKMALNDAILIRCWSFFNLQTIIL